jgi:hypothetical protein
LSSTATLSTRRSAARPGRCTAATCPLVCSTVYIYYLLYIHYYILYYIPTLPGDVSIGTTYRPHTVLRTYFTTYLLYLCTSSPSMKTPQFLLLLLGITPSAKHHSMK